MRGGVTDGVLEAVCVCLSANFLLLLVCLGASSSSTLSSPRQSLSKAKPLFQQEQSVCSGPDAQEGAG